MSAQIIEHNGKPVFAVIPIDEYRDLVKAKEDVEDIRDIRLFDAAMEQGEEELVPDEVVERLASECPVKVWREYRRVSQSALASAVGVTQSHVAMIERGEREGKVSVLVAIAKALKVSIDDLVF